MIDINLLFAFIGKVHSFLADTSLGHAIVFTIILFITWIANKIAHAVFTKNVLSRSFHVKVDPTQYALMRHAMSALIFIIGGGIAIFSIPSLRALSISLFAGAGVLAVVIGFASQKAMSNVISGVFIVIFQPFRVGDIVKFSDKIGIVEDITLRHTVIRSFENRRFVVPNSVISEETIENFNIGEEKTCRYVEFGISYDSDINLAMNIMIDEALKHPYFLDNRSDEDKEKKIPPVTVRVLGFGDSSVNLRAWVWAEDPGKAFVLGCDLNKSIKERFDKEGVEIPFPYRTVVYKKDIPKNKKFRGKVPKQKYKKPGSAEKFNGVK